MFSRRKAFAFRNRFDSLDEANEYLQSRCGNLNLKVQSYNDGKSSLEMLEIEREYMLPIMPVFDAARIEEPMVDKYSTIAINTCHYSIIDRYVGKMVLVKIYFSKVFCYYDGDYIKR